MSCAIPQNVSKATMIRMANAKSKSNLSKQAVLPICSMAQKAKAHVLLAASMEGHLTINTFEEPEVFESLELPVKGEEAYRDLDREVQAEKILLDKLDDMPSCLSFHDCIK